MAHKKYFNLCYIDCTDESHEIEEYGIWLHPDGVVEGVREYFDGYWSIIGDTRILATKEEVGKNKGFYLGQDDYFAPKIEDNLNSSFSNAPGANIPYPKDKYNNVPYNQSNSNSLIADNLLEANNFKIALDNYKIALDLEIAKYESSLNLSNAKENIKQTEILKLKANAISQQNAILQKNNILQEKIANKNTSFNVDNKITFDSSFASTLGETIANNLKPVLDKQLQTNVNLDSSFASTLGQTIANNLKTIIDQQNATLTEIKELVKVQDNYYKNLTTKSVTFEGNIYTPQEIQNLKNVENLKGAKDENSTDLNEFLGLFEEVIEDGFNPLINPFELIYKSINDDLIKESENIKIKYNL